MDGVIIWVLDAEFDGWINKSWQCLLYCVYSVCHNVSSIYNRRVLGMKSVHVVLFRIVQNLTLQSLFVLLLVHWFWHGMDFVSYELEVLIMVCFPFQELFSFGSCQIEEFVHKICSNEYSHKDFLDFINQSLSSTLKETNFSQMLSRTLDRSDASRHLHLASKWWLQLSAIKGPNLL